MNYKFNGKKIKGGPDGNGRYYVHDYDENGIEDGDEDYSGIIIVIAFLIIV